MIVLDTNVVSEALRPRPDERVVRWLEALTGEVAITAVTYAELLAGVRRLPARKRKTALGESVEAALQPYRATRAILPFDDSAANRYVEILVARELAGTPISMADAQIAAICLVHGASCATRNTKGFAHTGVALLDPWTS